MLKFYNLEARTTRVTGPNGSKDKMSALPKDKDKQVKRQYSVTDKTYKPAKQNRNINHNFTWKCVLSLAEVACLSLTHQRQKAFKSNKV